jgi:hypothetical protein
VAPFAHRVLAGSPGVTDLSEQRGVRKVGSWHGADLPFASAGKADVPEVGGTAHSGAISIGDVGATKLALLNRAIAMVVSGTLVFSLQSHAQ